MNKIVLLALLLIPGWAVAQAPAAQPPMNFCGVDVPVPSGCTPESGYDLRCDKYQLSWMYLNFGQLKPVVEEVLKQEKKKHKGLEQRPMDGFILDQPAQGYHLSYATETGMAYQLIFYGTAKGQPVVVQLTMDVDPEKTADLPEPARQIVRLTR
ncbi:hypothetical protein GCM10027048_39030 [Hymenobacter coalescens]